MKFVTWLSNCIQCKMVDIVPSTAQPTKSILLDLSANSAHTANTAQYSPNKVDLDLQLDKHRMSLRTSNAVKIPQTFIVEPHSKPERYPEEDIRRKDSDGSGTGRPISTRISIQE